MINTLNSKNKDNHAIILEAKDELIHVALNDQKEGIFICPACNNAVTRDLSKVSHVQTAIRIKCKCKCGHVFRVLVERRRNIRKSVNLVGMCYYNNLGNTQKRLIKILDVSTTGLQFSINDLPAFKVGKQIIVEFKLDDRERTEIKEKGIVKRIQSKNVGLRFASTERSAKFNLYLIH